MRPRTKSIASTREYFGQAPLYDMEEEEDVDWMAMLASGKDRSFSSDSVVTTDDEDDEVEVQHSKRVRTCSHDRRISFHDHVDVVEIPSRTSLNEDDKRRMWYSMAEFDQMRQVLVISR